MKRGYKVLVCFCLLLVIISFASAAYWDGFVTGYPVEDPNQDYTNGNGNANLIRGDTNGDGKVTLSDIVFLISYLEKDGPAPNPLEVADVNADGVVDNDDVEYLTDYLMHQGPPPVSFEEPEEVSLPKGDANGDGQVSISDLIYLHNYLWRQGPAPPCDPVESCGDANGDGRVSISDFLYLVNYLFRSGYTPVEDDVEGSCSETDEGMNFYMRGRTDDTTGGDGSGDFGNDVCIPTEDHVPGSECTKEGNCLLICDEGCDYIYEHYCGDNLLRVIPYHCPNGCENGACIVINSSKRGDTNSDGNVDIADVVFLISYLHKNGPAPMPLEVGDVNGDGNVDAADVEYLINYLFKGGPPPVPLEVPDEEFCDDSDGGFDYSVKGSVETSLGITEDECEVVGEAHFVHELYCVGNKMEMIKFRCSGLCENGACVSEADECKSGLLKRGDVNADGEVSIGDVVFLISYTQKGGPAPNPLDLGDVDNDGSVNSADVNYLNSYLFKGGSAPVGEEITGPNVKEKTRVIIGGVIKYCDPQTLTYKETKELDEVCVGDYECESNVCIDKKCTSIRRELERQASLLKQIWCAIIHPVDVFQRNDENQDHTNNNFLACLCEGSICE